MGVMVHFYRAKIQKYHKSASKTRIDRQTRRLFANFIPMQLLLTGVESTGKSALALYLSQKMQLPYVGECARQYLQYIGTRYTPQDVENIARLQQAAQTYAMQQHPFTVCDTDILVCKIWYEHKYQRKSALIEHLWQASAHIRALYLLPHLGDCAWQPDTLRETPDDAERQHLFNCYLRALQEAARPFLILRGSVQERAEQVQRALR